MTQPRYQVFVSSTFKDLKGERQAVLNAILKLNQFPAGMEIFPAVNDTAWEHIEKVIEVSDYYILIIGGKYGSMDGNGISYTEKEYDFAVSQNIPVLAFIHSQPGKIESDKTELNTKVRKKLDAFKKKVSKHHCNFWKTIEELKENVLASLSQSIVMNPQAGWVKADGIDTKELLTRLAGLQKRHDNLIEENNKIKDSVLFFDETNFIQGDDLFLVKFSFGTDDSYELEISCNQIISAIGENIIIQCEARNIKYFLDSYLLQLFRDTEKYDKKYDGYFNVSIDDKSLSTIEIQLLVLETILVSSVLKQFSAEDTIVRSFGGESLTRIEKTWQLSEKGRKLFLNQKALRQKQI